jgi:acetyl-CoA carboxylase biotin carboxyl carrier protein
MQNHSSKSEKPNARSSAEQSIDPVLVEQLAQIVTRLDLSEIEINQGDLRIRVARQLQTASASPSPPLPVTAVSPVMLASPTVASAATTPPPEQPEAKPFVDVGSQVKAGDKLLLIEAMKTFNEILAPRSGSVTAILIEDGQPVEFGEPLLVIE